MKKEDPEAVDRNAEELFREYARNPYKTTQGYVMQELGIPDCQSFYRMFHKAWKIGWIKKIM